MSGTKLPLPGCGVMGGVSPVTGKRVWNRHSWPDGWGQGRCRFCKFTLRELQVAAEQLAK